MTCPETTNWRDAAGALAAETRHFIDGGVCDSADGGRFGVVNPATGEVFAEVADGNVKDINKAVAAALRAHQTGAWRHLKPRARADVMRRFADKIRENKNELALLETLCMGKPIRDAVEGDIAEVALTIQFFAECVDKIEGKTSQPRRDVLHYVLREPLGVVGAISPWNYPALMAVWKFAPALAAGNCVVLKPAEQAPLSSLLMARLFAEAGGPAGVFNVVAGGGESAGKPLALHNDVAKISFTGSAEVGKQILIYAGQSNMKRVGLECGGKSPQIFLRDTPDRDIAAQSAADGIFANSGQVCNAGSRLLLDKSIYDEFLQKFSDKAKQYQPGDPLDWQTTLGPLVTRGDQKRVLSRIAEAKQSGARAVIGGDAPEGVGAFVNPTLMAEVPRDSPLAREEVFGPVAAALVFDGLDDAIQLANDTIYGLAASVWTTNIAHAHKAVREIEAGMIWVNSYFEDDMTQPFGGCKQSGNARDRCFESVLEYTQMKSAWVNLS